MGLSDAMQALNSSMLLKSGFFPQEAVIDQFKSYGARGDMFATLAREGALRVDGDTSKRG